MSDQFVYCPGLCGMKVRYKGDPNNADFCCVNCWNVTADMLGMRGDAPPLGEDYPKHSDQCPRRQHARRNAPVLDIAVGFRVNLRVGGPNADNDPASPAPLP